MGSLGWGGEGGKMGSRGRGREEHVHLGLVVGEGTEEEEEEEGYIGHTEEAVLVPIVRI